MFGKLSLIVVLLLVNVSVTFADPIEFVYDNGSVNAAYRGMNENNMEAVCFSPEHPCSLLSIRIYVHEADRNAPSAIEIHFWGDNGAHEPDQSNDLIDPIEVQIERGNRWITIDLTRAGLVLNPPQDFHVGHICSNGGPSIFFDNSQSCFEERSHVWAYNQNYRTSMWHIMNSNYMVRATFEYFNEIEEFPFVNVSNEMGLVNLENHAWGDYDNDGWEDLLIGGRKLYRNLSGSSFENVSDAAGIRQDNPGSTGTWGDFDNDGWLDFFAGNNNNNCEDRLYHNNGNGTFTMSNNEYWMNYGYNPTGGSGWGDANGDGCLEIYIANAENWNDGNPEYFADYFLSFNPADRVFLDIAPREITELRYYGRGVAWCDFDMDGDMDVYISNYRLQPNYLWVNYGNFEFRNEADERGSLQGYGDGGVYGHTIGSAWADFDNDLDFDLLVGNFAHPWGLSYQDKVMLCRNSGSPEYRFEDIFAESGIKYCETVFSPAWGDYDNDGWQDVFISACYEGRQPFMYRNMGNTTFRNVNYQTGFHTKAYDSNGVTWCDYDHDGDLDLAIGGSAGGLFQNNCDVGHWIQIELRGVSANRFGFGSKATVHSDGEHYLRQVEGGSGAEGCQNMMAMHFGLGEHNHCDSLLIDWIGGEVDRYYNVDIDKRWYAVQGEGLFEELEQHVNDHEKVPLNFSMAYPYPNPFNGSMTLEFSQSTFGPVKIQVFDLSGREIDMIANRDFSPGNHTIAWNAKDFPAGRYLVQVKHRNGILSRMITLLK